jgi:hypothetical protein
MITQIAHCHIGHHQSVSPVRHEAGAASLAQLLGVTDLQAVRTLVGELAANAPDPSIVKPGPPIRRRRCTSGPDASQKLSAVVRTLKSMATQRDRRYAVIHLA